jgi:phosphoglycolate phosphatase-like HAD superfamily hydrolase
MSDHPAIDTVVLDVDGTLVDTVYQHTMTWAAAFAEVDVVVPLWRVHRAIGMGADRLVAHVAGDEVERRHGDRVREAHDRRFTDLVDDVRPLPGAGDLLAELRRRGFTVALASSGEKEQTERLLRLVDGSDRVDVLVTGSEVEHSKPAPDLVETAVERAAGNRAAVVGDAVWDVAAAREKGRYAIGLRCGGSSEADLRDTGAAEVFDDPDDLVAHLDETALRSARP